MKTLATILLFSMITLILTGVINSEEAKLSEFNKYPKVQNSQKSFWVKPVGSDFDLEDNECFLEIPPYYKTECLNLGGYVVNYSGTPTISGISNSGQTANFTPYQHTILYVQIIPEGQKTSPWNLLADSKFNENDTRKIGLDLKK